VILELAKGEFQPNNIQVDWSSERPLTIIKDYEEVIKA